MGQLLYFYFIEAHSDRVVAAEFCKRLYAKVGWTETMKADMSDTFPNIC